MIVFIVTSVNEGSYLVIIYCCRFIEATLTIRGIQTMRGWRQLHIIFMMVTETVLVISSCMQVRVDAFFVAYLLIPQIETRLF